MNTTADAADPCRLKQAIDDVRSDLGGVERRAWLLVGHINNNPNLIDVISADTSAQASLDDFRSKLDPQQVMYGLLRVTSSGDMATTTVRFIYVHWIGDEVPFARRGRFGVVHGSVKANFRPWHVQIETASLEEVEDEELVRLVEEGCMRRSRVIEPSELEGRQERGYTTRSMPRSISGTLTTADPKPRRPGAPAGGPVPAAPELTQAIGEVRDDKAPTSWVVAGFEDGDLNKPLILVAKGSGDLEEMKGVLSDDQIMYAFYRNVNAMDDIPSVKFVYMYWMGQKVKLLMKGKVSAFLGPVEEHFAPVHASLSVSCLEEISPGIISDKVLGCSRSTSFIK